ncbi:organic hydroperoxide resistance protein [Nocardia otitidiscaviarum]|uniref:organic hydroperoxide resistance protein n=1 Tax=Nocardia otitidiscaviarum TaxID=1823 RepID=UPI0018935B5B|nr:organic hydroperoxide resistance protein [Nocardia otitidiscaviarum]MBF6239572.1 organic hydroperoxide resistance protein [Nocardia otitidiscaviarum]
MAPMYTAVATSAGREGRSYSDDGILDLTLARPRALGGDGAGTNPEQLFAAGYSACFASALQLVAKRMKLDADEAAVTAEVGLNSREGGGFSLSVVLRVELPEHLHNESGRALVEATHQVCPYSHATQGNIPVELVVE